MEFSKLETSTLLNSFSKISKIVFYNLVNRFYQLVWWKVVLTVPISGTRGLKRFFFAKAGGLVLAAAC